MASYQATIEYRDEYSRGQWRTHTVISDSREGAMSRALAHCSDCEHRNLKVEALDERMGTH